MTNLTVFKDYPQVEKLWGTEIWLTNTPLYCAKLLHLQPEYKCSLHYHPIKTETFIILEGEVGVEYGQDSTCLVTTRYSPGDKIDIPPTHPHRFYALDNNPALILEVSTQHSDTDVVRLQESTHLEDVF